MYWDKGKNWNLQFKADMYTNTEVREIPRNINTSQGYYY